MTQPGRKRNYQKELDRLIGGLREKGRVSKLLLYSRCAPCNSYVLEYLSQYLDATVYYYNPNTSPETKYKTRVREQGWPIREMETGRLVKFLVGSYGPEELFPVTRSREKDPEGGEQCFHCYELQPDHAARTMASGDFDYFTTTLSIDPLKNAQQLNDIGCRLVEQYGILYLVPDFKKKSGYKRSVELSALYGLYRQDYRDYVYFQAEVIERRREPAVQCLQSSFVRMSTRGQE